MKYVTGYQIVNLTVSLIHQAKWAFFPIDRLVTICLEISNLI